VKKLDNKEERQRLKRNRGAVALASLVLLVLGAIGMLWAVNASGVYANLIDEEHMTDTGIAYRDLDNATYTYDREYLQDHVDNIMEIMLVSTIPLMVGLGVFYAMIAMPDEKDDHRRFCDGTSKKEYCPECGLKLSRLEEN
jgi:hypothetical protein